MRITSAVEAEIRARRYLPRPIFAALESGIEGCLTRDWNVQAYADIGLIPRIANLPNDRDTCVTVWDRRLAFPVILAPAGAQAIRPEGEVPIARAAHRSGTVMGLSNFASCPIEDVVAAGPGTFSQLYWVGTRSEMEGRIKRARDAGASALFLTLDWAHTTRRDRGTPSIPERLTPFSLLQFAPHIVGHPRWLFGFANRRAIPSLKVPNAAPAGVDPPGFAAYLQEVTKSSQPTWDDVAWAREQFGGPFFVKGVMHPDDARRAVDVGANGIVVSNHGGNNIDTTPPSILALPPVVEAVGGQLEILLDGGIRRGLDVVKAIALGAKAVMIGRPYLYAYAAGGEQGVRDILDVLRAGIEEVLLALGKGSLADLREADVILPRHVSDRE